MSRSKNTIIYTIAFALLGVAGNHFNLPLFFSVSFIFGSIAALIALRTLGLLPALIVAAVAGSYTWVLWGHPYAMMIFTLEVFFVWLLSKRIPNPALADMIYWVLIGAPLVLLTYGGVMNMANNAATLIALKQSVNGVFNAVSATMILYLAGNCRFWPNTAQKIGFSTLLFNIFLFVTVMTGGTLIVMDSARVAQLEAERLRESMQFFAHLAEKEAAESFAEAQSSESAYQSLQKRLEKVQDIARVGTDVGIAFLNEDGSAAFIHGQVASLTDAGEIKADRADLNVWSPEGESAVMVRWRASRYLFDLPVEQAAVPASFIRVEQAAAPLVSRLDTRSKIDLIILSAIMMIALIGSHFLSHWLSRTISVLGAQSHAWLAYIQGEKSRAPNFPESSIVEIDALSSGLRIMTNQAYTSFVEIREMKEGLERRVTERTEEIRRLSEVASQTTNAVVITDLEGRVEWINQGFTRMTGYEPETILGKKPGHLLQGRDTDPRTKQTIKEAISKKQHFHVEIINYSRSGRPYWVEISCNPLRDQSGEITGFIAIETDITDRKKTEQVLDRTLERLALAVEAGGIGVWEYDVKNARLTWDENMFPLYGFDPNGFMNKFEDWHGCIVDEDKEEAAARVHAALAPDAQPFDAVFRINHPDLGIRHIAGKAHVVRDETGAPLRMMGVNMDITVERDRARALSEAAQHMQTVFDNVVDAIITIDERGCIESYNRAAEEMFGYTAEEVMGANIAILMPEHHAIHHDGYVKHYQNYGTSRQVSKGRELEGKRKDGSLFQIELAISDVMRKGERIFIGIIRDITERKRIERLKSEFISTVSHELRTPLTSITGAIGLVGGGALGEIPEKARPMLENALRNSRRLSALINDLLDMDKIAAGKMEFRKELSEVSSLIETAIESNSAFAQTRGISLAIENAPKSCAIHVDQARVGQILTNYISNAVKFSEVGKKVKVSAQVEGNEVVINVKDDGLGIAPEFQSRLFEKFSQDDASDSRRMGGTGLGLAISKELAENMGGKVGFSSRLGKGSIFWVRFPLANADQLHLEEATA